jgi:SrtB family sortase
MNENHWYQPESQDALEAVDEVCCGGKKKKSFFEQNMFPVKGDSGKERARKVIFDLMVLIMIGSLLVLTWWGGIDPWMHNRTMGRIDDLLTFTCSVCDSPWPEDEPYCTVCVAEPQVTQDPEQPPPTRPNGETIPVTSPRVPVRRMSFDELLNENSDTVGWLTVPGANISMPVVQTTDNNFYLYRDFQRRPSRYGHPFLDSRSRIRTWPQSTNHIFYGHHMRNLTIFSRLTNFQNWENVRRQPLITFELTTGETWQYIIFSVILVNGRPEHDNGFIFAANTPDFPHQESFDGFIRQLRQRSSVNVDLDVRWGDSLVTLQTCVYDFQDAFLFVYGRRLRPGESPPAASAFSRNPNPHHPHIMFQRRNVENPFRDDRWGPG